MSDIYVGCSGNFTLEKFIGPLERFRLHSNDVTMYSLCLGAHFMRELFALTFATVFSCMAGNWRTLSSSIIL